jgi:putative FmdB family regulatory protein
MTICKTHNEEREMPTYEYKCESCGYEFEQFQSITAKPIRKCPKCSKTSVRRLIGVGAGIIFKGSGFYATDYRSESYKKAAESEKGTTSKNTEKKIKAEFKEPKSIEKVDAGSKEKKKSA